MPGAQKTRGYLIASYPGQPSYKLDQLIEFSYRSDVMSLGDTCDFKLVNERDGSTLDKVRSGSTVKLYLANPAINGGVSTLKHFGRIVQREINALEGTVRLTCPDLGWHLMSCHAPLWMRLKGLTLEQLLDPLHPKSFLDSSFQLQGVRTSNDLNRRLKQGRAGTLAYVNKVLTPVNVIQVEPGESYHDTLSRYCQRFNLLVNVSCDGFLQVWNPDYDRPPAYRFYKTPQGSNVMSAIRHDDITTRYSEVRCIGEVINPILLDPNNPNAKKRKGVYKAATDASGLPAPLPFTHRFTFGDGEMWTGDMARAQAEWRWKRGMFDSHYLEVTVADHFQGDAWLESDQLASVEFPELGAEGLYYVQAAYCTSTKKEGDITKLILRWPHLLSASFGEWPSPPVSGSKEAEGALKKGTGSGQ